MALHPIMMGTLVKCITLVQLDMKSGLVSAGVSLLVHYCLVIQLSFQFSALIFTCRISLNGLMVSILKIVCLFVGNRMLNFVSYHFLCIIACRATIRKYFLFDSPEIWSKFDAKCWGRT